MSQSRRPVVELFAVYTSTRTGNSRQVLGIKEGWVYYKILALPQKPPFLYRVGDERRCTVNGFQNWMDRGVEKS